MKKLLKIINFYIKDKKTQVFIPEKFLNLFFWKKAIKPYAFIRVKNEIKTIDTSLKSILPFVKGGVIGFHECTDGTKEYIEAFCKKYPQFKPYEYPYPIYPVCDEYYKNDMLDDYNSRIDTYYNKVLEQLPKNEWIIKIDLDHVYDSGKMRKLCKLPFRDHDVVILNRINLHIYNNEIYIDKINPIMEFYDHWIIYNKGLEFNLYRGWNGNKFIAYEQLPLKAPEHRFILSILANWHFPIIKSQRNYEFDTERWVLLSKFDINSYIQENNLVGRVSKDMLDEKRILDIYAKFNMSEKKILP